MNGNVDDDPIGSHTHLNVLRRCLLAGGSKSGGSDSDSSDSESFRVESTGIFMLSLPDSMGEEDDSTSALFRTAPEELGSIDSDERMSVAADAMDVNVSVKYVDDGKAVDLGRDTDVGLFSEVQSSTETVDKEESIEILCNYKEKFSEKEVKERVENSQSRVQSKLREEIPRQSSSRVLPPSISGVEKDVAGKQSDISDDQPEAILLKILKILKGEEVNEIDDKSLSKLSILDILRRRGITFPRPDWWPPEY